MLTLQEAGILNSTDHLSISLKMADGSIYRYGGEINFTDVTVSDNTDTLTLRAGFPNPAQQLISGQFVTVILEYESPVEKIVIPQASLMSSPTGKYVYTVDAQNKVVNRPVTTGTEQGKDIVILDGLEEGEQVIVEGLQKVRPGQEVVVDAPALKKAAAKPASSKTSNKK